ncbi:MAG: hypothetical protein V1895_01330 [Parcubacteria group bacterium]
MRYQRAKRYRASKKQTLSRGEPAAPRPISSPDFEANELTLSGEDVRLMGLIRRDVAMSTIFFVLIVAGLVSGWLIFKDDERVKLFSTQIGEISGFIQE